MKVALQEGMAPGASLVDKLQATKLLGYDGIEVNYRTVLEQLAELQAAVQKTGLPVSTVCGSGRHDIICANRAERESRLAEIRTLLDRTAALGAVGLIFVPVRTGAALPDLTPYLDSQELMTRMSVAILQDLAGYAAERGTRLLLEPLIRYETPFVRRLEQAVAICEEVASPGLALMADFFHMNTEEESIPASIEAASPWLKHVHLADSNRQTPGRGHTDFVSGFQALNRIGFDGYMALECALPGDRVEELGRSLKFIHDSRCAALANLEAGQIPTTK